MSGMKPRRFGLTTVIADLSLGSILTFLALRFVLHANPTIARIPLPATLAVGGVPLVHQLLRKVFRLEFGANLLAGIAIVTSVLLGEYLAGAIVVLMLSGDEALESYALRSASSVLRALANRMPSVAHRKRGGAIADVPLDAIAVGDTLVVYPHDLCPVDVVVTEGHGVMNEAFLTGEPFKITKAPGVDVSSGAINGESALALTIAATRLAVDSRYSKITAVMRASEQNRPRIRRLGDRLGAIYTPVAVAVALLAWAIIGTISLAARRSIIIKDPAALEQITQCRTAIFDKTGTLTYGEPKLTDQFIAKGFGQAEVLGFAAGLERYSKHPLAGAVLAEAKAQKLPLAQATHVSEATGEGLCGTVADRQVQITSRGKVVAQSVSGAEQLPPEQGGLECIVVIDGTLAALYHLRDAPRAEGRSLIQHLGPKHQFRRVMILSGDRVSEVKYLAEQVGITEIHAEQSPEQKLAIVRAETASAKTLYVGDGINDAPAMMAATVGMAVGHNSDVTAEAADVVVMDNSLKHVDEFMHIGRRMRRIALQSVVGGMALSVLGMGLAAAGLLGPVAGAISQEVIDVLAVLNALRAAWPPKVLSDVAS